MTQEASGAPQAVPKPLPVAVAVLIEMPPAGAFLFKVVDRKIDRLKVEGQGEAEHILCSQFPPGTFLVDTGVPGEVSAPSPSELVIFLADEKPPNNQSPGDLLADGKGTSLRVELDTPVTTLIKEGTFSSLVHQILHSLFEAEKIT